MIILFVRTDILLIIFSQYFCNHFNKIISIRYCILLICELLSIGAKISISFGGTNGVFILISDYLYL